MRYITANQIFSGKEFLSDNMVIVLNQDGLITDVTTINQVESSNIEYFEGIITPGFINTHCHLELSHLKNLIPQKTGIVDFGLAVIKHRNDIALEFKQEAMLQADKEMFSQGIVAVGDISNTDVSIQTKQQSKLYYHTFIELIALNPERTSLVFDAGKQLASQFENAHLSWSFAPHAPYSTSVELIKKISDDCFELSKPTSIHNQESKAENDFFNSKSGDYLRLYKTLNISIDYFKAFEKSSLQSIVSYLNAGVNTLLVHNTFSSEEDLKMASTVHQKLFWCLCPNANIYIENTLPNVQLLIDNDCMLTLGTDSLASNFQLSIINEMNTIMKWISNISLEVLLKAATYNGAKFLGLEKNLGLIEKNKKCGLNLIEGFTGNYTVKKLA